MLKKIETDKVRKQLMRVPHLQSIRIIRALNKAGKVVVVTCPDGQDYARPHSHEYTFVQRMLLQGYGIRIEN